jgi:ABC-type cobalt transport system substrate-binding protein
MNRSRYEWLAPLTGVAFVVLVIISFVLQGEPPGADEPAEEIVDHYLDNKDSIEIGAFLGGVAATLFVFFWGYMRKILRAAEGESGMLSLVALVGAGIIAVGAAIDGTISFAIAERADDIEPASVQTLQALWDNDFLPFAVGSQLLWFAAGISVVRHGALPAWLGWVAILLGVVSLTPLGFFAFGVGALWILIVSIMLTMRARGESAAPAA